eukprot:7309499-Lingulodinium_polyedra.AAC.1
MSKFWPASTRISPSLSLGAAMGLKLNSASDVAHLLALMAASGGPQAAEALLPRHGRRRRLGAPSPWPPSARADLSRR